MPVHTRTQTIAQHAYSAVAARLPQLADEKARDTYISFAREFPSLVHTCGLSQAVAFALARRGKPQEEYAKDLASVLHAAGHGEITDVDQLAEKTRTHPVAQYLRLSRDALAVAVWLKRHVEAAEEA